MKGKDIYLKMDKCEFCGREDRKATRNDLNGLCLLWPDERLICNSCLRSECLKVNITR